MQDETHWKCGKLKYAFASEEDRLNRLAIHKVYRLKNRDALNAKQRLRYSVNENSCREEQKEYRNTNIEKVRKWRRDSYHRNKDTILEKLRTRAILHPELRIYKAAKTRAKQKDLPFNLELSDIRVPTKCPVLNIPLKVNMKVQSPNSPSLDRIDPAKGYVKSNVIVISSLANAIKQNVTPEEILQVGKFFKRLQQDKDMDVVYRGPFQYNLPNYIQNITQLY